ncbi:MAG: transposase [Actinobacteria bacterium]|nr:transposase [Actinomycetota bacterium]
MESKIKATIDGYDQFIGIDHHKKQSCITVKDRQGEIIRKKSVDTSKENIKAFLDTGDEEMRKIAILECGRTCRPVYRWLKEEVDKVVLAHPAGLKIISDTVKKNDKLDSEKLCDLLMIGMIPESYPASDEAWGRRLVIRQRAALVKVKTQVKNRIHNGNSCLRRALVEAAVPATRSNLSFKNLYDRICARKSKKAGPNIAKVAVARKLSEIVYVILRDERPYEIR